jgi:hypothetical protein
MTQEDIDLFMESVDIGYTRCKVQPMTGLWLHYENDQVYCCGITAALINKNGIEGLDDANAQLLMPYFAEREFNLDQMFISGFLAGFDRADYTPEFIAKSSVTNTEYVTGYKCGKEKREKWILKEKQQ